MTLPIIINHPSAGKHQVPAGHPERPERYHSIIAMLAASFPELPQRQAPAASRQQLQLVHSADHVQQIFTSLQSTSKLVSLDSDTWGGPDSLTAALHGAGAACFGVDLVMADSNTLKTRTNGSKTSKAKVDASKQQSAPNTAAITQQRVRRVISVLRPPGHHAEPTRPLGFCFFSNAAIAAQHARQAWGLQRVAVIDFDVHHGNGTQAAFWQQSGLFYASSHQMPLFPGTGAISEVGEYNNIINFPLTAGDGGAKFLAAWRETLLPRLAAVKPQLIVISAGFDAHKADPLANLLVETEDFAALTSDIIDLADEFADGRVVSLLEGGYDLTALTESLQAHLAVLASK